MLQKSKYNILRKIYHILRVYFIFFIKVFEYYLSNIAW